MSRDKRKNTANILLLILAGIVLLLIVILPLRGLMNEVSRSNFVSQRLDDYPHLYDDHQKENDQWWEWWQTEDYQKRAEQAAFLYETITDIEDEEEKLEYISLIVGAETAQIVRAKDLESVNEINSSRGWSTSSAELADGHILVLSMHEDIKEDRMKYLETRDALLSQLESGLPGHIVVLHDGTLSVYPHDEDEDALKSLIQEMLESGELDPAKQKIEAQNSEKGTASVSVRNPRTERTPWGKYRVFGVAYADNDDYVMNVAESSDLIRFGRKRSWILWYLCSTILVLAAFCMWRTRLYAEENDLSDDYKRAKIKGFFIRLFACVMLFGSVAVTQLLSNVNLSQQGATDQAAYLKTVLDQEASRAAQITDEFDKMYKSRVEMAAMVLSEKPELIDVDSLYRLDQALGGKTLRIFNVDGSVLASDEVLMLAVDDRFYGNSVVYDFNESGGTETQQDLQNRYYRTFMTDQYGKTTGFVELTVSQDQLDQLLMSTGLKEKINDLHLFETMRVVVAETGAEGKIIADTSKKWEGETPAKHGILSDQLYEGYEGIINFEDKKCYSIVFRHNDYYIIVGSEPANFLVILGGIMLIYFVLLLVMIPVLRSIFKKIILYQKWEAVSDQERFMTRKKYPPLRDFFEDFLIAVFMLSAVLFISTRGNPVGLTYNIVRGTWRRGVNAATVTTCIMLVSVVFAVLRMMSLFFLKMSEYLSPRSVTICQLFISVMRYFGTAVAIIYTLSMFGVNTTTLVGGVGVIALVFTISAQSLLADVAAGVFLIFEGDFTIGDMIVVDGFRGIVTDISIRTTKLQDEHTRDVRIINNSKIVSLTNQSREKSAVIVDVTINPTVDIRKMEEVLMEKVKALPQRFPEIIGEPEYWGISKLPEWQPRGAIGDYKARIVFYCKENDKNRLFYQVNRELVSVVQKLDLEKVPGTVTDIVTPP